MLLLNSTYRIDTFCAHRLGDTRFGLVIGLCSQTRTRQARFSWVNASFAALAPHMPCAPGPGGVAAEQMYIPGIPTRYGFRVGLGPKTNWRMSFAPVTMSPPT